MRRSKSASERSRDPSAFRRPVRQSTIVPKTSKVKRPGGTLVDLTLQGSFGNGRSPAMPEMKFCPSCAAPLRPKKVEGRVRLSCDADGCEYVFYDNPTPVVAALIEHGGTVLLVRNKEWPEKWDGLVTGFLEKDESPEEGGLREVREELRSEERRV